MSPSRAPLSCVLHTPGACASSFGCPKGYDEAKECDIFGTPTFERVQKIKAMERYITKVDKYRKDEKLTALNYEAMQSTTHKVDKEARVELEIID